MQSAKFDNFIEREPIILITTAIIATAVRLVEILNVEDERFLRGMMNRSGGSVMALVEVCISTMRVVTALFIYRKICTFFSRKLHRVVCSTRSMYHAVGFLTLGIMTEGGTRLLSSLVQRYISSSKKEEYNNIVVEYVANRPFLFTAVAVEFFAYVFMQRFLAPLTRLSVMALSTLVLIALMMTRVSDIAKDFK